MKKAKTRAQLEAKRRRTWGPEKLYGESKGWRRLLYLELVAWGIRRGMKAV